MLNNSASQKRRHEISYLLRRIDVMMRELGKLEEKEHCKRPSNEEILKYYGWEIICRCPYELTHPDGSSASGNAAIRLIVSLREEWIQEQRDLLEQDEEIPEDSHDEG